MITERDNREMSQREITERENREIQRERGKTEGKNR